MRRRRSRTAWFAAFVYRICILINSDDVLPGVSKLRSYGWRLHRPTAHTIIFLQP